MVTWGSHFNPRYLFTFADVHHVVAGYRTAPSRWFPADAPRWGEWSLDPLPGHQWQHGAQRRELCYGCMKKNNHQKMGNQLELAIQ
jgi:hypothetical protein